MTLKKTILIIISVLPSLAWGQMNQDTISKNQWWNFHYQSTIINQIHPAFHADYSGNNSLKSSEESNTSITTTLYLGAKVWKGAAIYFNPELSGGSGFSKTTGIAGFTNGEVYRVSDPSPQVYIGRLYLRQIIPLSKETNAIDDAANQLAGKMPASYLSFTAGKYSVMDFFDNNSFSHDPRTQFYNWALMGNGAWDYPANTRGYTYGLTIELVKSVWALRYMAVLVSIKANGAEMDNKFTRSNSHAFEFEHKYNLFGENGTVRLITFFTQARMGSYTQSIAFAKSHNIIPNIDTTAALGHTKYGFGINIEHNINKNLGLFFRSSWNDGQNETWAFTEIDKTLSAGAQLNGNLWNRKEDCLSFAFLINGLSKEHRNYLNAGGYGFIIGDGKLNYGTECITEIYYAFKLRNTAMTLSPDYQFVLHPAYNKDRGPVNVFGIRAHFEL
jgi:high affinity Mn2+ porin